MTAHARAKSDEELEKLQKARMYTHEQLCALTDKPYDLLGLDYEQLLKHLDHHLAAGEQSFEEEEGWYANKFQSSVDCLLQTGSPLHLFLTR